MKKLLAFLAVGALATAVGCGGPTRTKGTTSSTQQNRDTNQSSVTHEQKATPGAEGEKGATGDKNAPGEKGTAAGGKTGTGGSTMASVKSGQEFTVQHGKTADVTLQLQDKPTAATTVTHVDIQNNKGLKVEINKVAADADTAKVHLDATKAQAGDYTVSIPASETMKAGSFTVHVK